MKVYRIRGWNELYENNRTRELKQLTWVPVPNNHDGDGYTALVTHKEGAALFGAWVAIVQVASKCDPRGTLLRRAGVPHDSASLSRITRLPEPIFDLILRIAEIELNWLESDELQLSLKIPHDDAVIPHDDAPRARALREGKGREGKGTEEGSFLIPSKFRNAETEAAWENWQNHRSEIKKTITPTGAKQILGKLEEWGSERWVAAVNHSITNGWQGLFEPKTNGVPQRQKYVPNI